MLKKQLKRLFVLSIVIFIFSVSIFGQAVTVLENDFEKGTQKWETRGERVNISASKDQAQTGAKSLKISGRAANWQGTQLNITNLIKKKNIYQFTVSVKLAKNETPDEIKMTMQRGDNGFDGIGAATVTANEWTTISGKFKASGDDPYLLVYIEAGRANTSYFIDDFKIENLGDDIPTQSGVILKTDFEDMTAQNWFTRGDGVQMFSSNAGGSQNLKVSSRTQNWHGLQLDVSPILFKGRTYEISLQVRLVKGQPKDNVTVTMQQTPSKGEIQNIIVVPPTAITDSEWTTLTGTYTATTNDNNLVIFVQTASATTSFHIDNFSIKVP